MSARGVFRILRAIAGVIVLVVLIFMVNRWIGDYRGAKPDGAAHRESTSTTEPAKKPASKTATAPASPKKVAQHVQILMDGVNFRTKPDSAAEVIRGLNEGEKLTLLKKQDNWYYCQDADGKKGWLSANSSYAKVVK